MGTNTIAPTDANALKSFRKRMGYSVTDAANKLGIGRATWTRYESGEPIPKYVGLAMAALALGLGGEDDGPPSDEE